MSQRRQLRSDKDVTLTRLEDTPKSARRKSSVKNNPLTSTPSKRESTETAKRLSSSFVKQQSRQDQEMENADQSILSNSLLINNNNISRFDDKPEHLYGLDNPAEISNDRERVELKYKTGYAQDKPVNKICQLSICFLACFCFCLLVIWTGINMNQHNEKQQDIAEKQQMKLEIKLLKDQLKEVKHMLSDHWLKSNQDHTFQKVFLRDQSAPITQQQFQELIDESLRRWDADKTGLADYALESTGGQIHSSYHSATFANGAPQVLLFGIPLWHDVKTPRVVIQPGNSPGECWAFQGRTGFVVIKLSQMIKPSSFTLEHMPASLSQFGDQSIPSAPKEFSVWGWSDAHGNEKTLLGEYVFDNKGHALQRFPVQATTVSEYRFIELKVHSNYGNPSYTCLYRFRVHGSPHRNNN